MRDEHKELISFLNIARALAKNENPSNAYNELFWSIKKESGLQAVIMNGGKTWSGIIGSKTNLFFGKFNNEYLFCDYDLHYKPGCAIVWNLPYDSQYEKYIYSFERIKNGELELAILRMMHAELEKINSERI